MTSARERFARAGATTWCLNVKRDNHAAIALYERFGLRIAYRSTMLRLANTIALPQPAADLVLSPVPPELDAVIEPQLRLLPGQLASARARPSRQVLQLSRGAEVLGVGVVLPSIPGAFPFRLVEPGFAAAFLALLRPRVPADAGFVQMGVEDDELLDTEVQRLGGTLQLELVHLRGAIS